MGVRAREEVKAVLLQHAFRVAVCFGIWLSDYLFRERSAIRSISPDALESSAEASLPKPWHVVICRPE